MINKKIAFLKTLITAGTIAALSMNANAALTCPVGTQASLDWDVVDWTDPTNAGGGTNYNPTLSQSFVAGGINFSFAFTSDVPDLLASLESVSTQLASPDDISITIGPGDLDGNGSNDQGLGAVVNPLDGDNGNAVDLDVIMDVTFSEPVSQFEFSMSDIDQTAGRRDRMTILGFYMGAPVVPTLSNDPRMTGAQTATYTIASNVATADAGAGNRTPTNSPEEATVFATFAQPIDALQVIYADDDETTLAGGRGVTMANDFGFCPAPDISGTVFEDADGDSIFSVGDTRISGVTVQLFADDGAGNPTGAALYTQVTDVNGNYIFADLLPDDYVIVETDLSGYVSVTDIDGDTTSPAFNQISVTLASANIIGQNFLDIPSADLSIDKDDSSLTYTPGTNFAYTIVVSNGGPADANGVVVADSLPAWATNVTWTCGSPTGGAVCPNATGTGDLNETIAIFPANSSLTYIISGTYSINMTDYPEV